MADITGQIGDSLTDRVSFETKTPAKESRVFIGAPDYRVFLWGVDITDDVYGVQVTQQMDDQVGTAQIHIANDNQKWTVPTALGLIGYDALPDELSLGDNEEPLFTKTAPGTNTQLRRHRRVTPVKFAKQKIANFKASISQNQKLGEAGNALLKEFSNSQNFPFLPGSSMFQMGDPVRVFFKNPWNIAGKDDELFDVPTAQLDQEEWYFAFTGYVAAVTEDFDAATNQSKLHLFCEDIRRLLRYMRTTTSPNVFNINVTDALLTGKDAQDFLKRVSADATIVTGNAAVQAGMKLVNTSTDGSGAPGIMDLLLFGNTGNRPSNFQTNETEPGMQLVTGLLGFTPEGKVVRLIEGSAGGGAIERQVSELLDDLYPQLTESQVDSFGVDWSLGSEPTVAPEPNRFYVILPDKSSFSNDGTPDGSTFRWPYDWGMRITYFSEFRSRLDVINEFVQAQDSIWYATPKGDIVLEFPQYDMIPQLHSKPWRNILQIQNEFTKFSLTEDDRNIKTLTIAQGSPIADIDNKGIPPISIGVKFNAQLAARFGVREQRNSRPFKYSQDYLNSSLNSLSAMWQELANSDCYRLEGLETLPNFRAPIARPYFFKYRNLVGFCTAVHHQIVWGSVAQTIYELKYVRHFDVTSGSWQKISGKFGWSWTRNDNISGDSGAGAKIIEHSQDGLAERLIQDPSANLMREFVGDIRFREGLLGPGQELLSEPDKQALEGIADQLDRPVPPSPEERKILVDEANKIMKRIRA